MRHSLWFWLGVVLAIIVPLIPSAFKWGRDSRRSRRGYLNE